MTEGEPPSDTFDRPVTGPLVLSIRLHDLLAGSAPREDRMARSQCQAFPFG